MEGETAATEVTVEVEAPTTEAQPETEAQPATESVDRKIGEHEAEIEQLQKAEEKQELTLETLEARISDLTARVEGMSEALFQMQMQELEETAETAEEVEEAAEEAAEEAVEEVVAEAVEEAPEPPEQATASRPSALRLMFLGK